MELMPFHLEKRKARNGAKVKLKSATQRDEGWQHKKRGRNYIMKLRLQINGFYTELFLD